MENHVDREPVYDMFTIGLRYLIFSVVRPSSQNENELLVELASQRESFEDDAVNSELISYR